MGGDHIDEKAERAFISDFSPVSGDDIDAASGADLKVQQGPTKMLRGQIRVLLPLKWKVNKNVTLLFVSATGLWAVLICFWDLMVPMTLIDVGRSDRIVAVIFKYKAGPQNMTAPPGFMVANISAEVNFVKCVNPQSLYAASRVWLVLCFSILVKVYN